MNLEEEIINRAASQMSKQIDFEVLSSMLCQSGWTKIILKPMSTETSDEIDAWTSKIKGEFRNMGLVWIFEDPYDAVNFTLKWA